MFNMATAPSSPKTIGDTAYTVQASDNNAVLVFNNADAITVTIPVGLPSNFQCCFVQEGAGQITVVDDGVTINNRQTQTKTAGQYALISLVAIAQDVYVLGGDTGA